MVDRTPIDSIQTKLDYTTTAGVIYLGQSLAGSLDNENAWCVRKMELDSNSNVISITYSNGLLAQNVKWSDRATLTYKQEI